MLKHKIIVLTGCTASGKSSIGIKLAKKIDAVIINADSRQIYKELTIGTAKPIPDTIKGKTYYIENIPHYLYSTVSVKEEYNIYKYQKDVKEILKKIPTTTPVILLGGTGLYIDSIIKNFQLKETVDKRNYDIYSISQLKNMVGSSKLKQLNESDRENPRRLIRILQKSASKENINTTQPLNHIYIVVDVEKDILNKNIEKRVEQMFENCLLKENEELRKKGLNRYRGFRTIGYQEFDKYFSEERDLVEIKKEIINHTRQYAKRQRTWFRRNKNAIWCKTFHEILGNVQKYIIS